MPSLDPTLLRPCRLYFSLNVSGDAWLVTGISVTDATGSSSPATATFSSSRFLMNGSISASTSYSNTFEHAGDQLVGRRRGRHAGARSEVARLDDHRPAEGVCDLRRQRRAARPSRDRARARSHDSHGTTGTPACDGDDLRQPLVHADGRRRHAAADIRAAAELEQPLDAAVLAERAVENRNEDVDWMLRLGRTERPRRHRHQRRGAEAGRQRHFGQPRPIGPAALERLGVPEVVADPPAQLLIDVDRHGVNAIADRARAGSAGR